VRGSGALRRSTHNAFSFALCLWVAKLLLDEPLVLVVLLALIATLFTNWFIDSVAGHRGPRRTPYTHSILGASAISLLLTLSTYTVTVLLNLAIDVTLLKNIFILALVSSLSHLLLDAFTADGVALLWPFKKRRVSLTSLHYDNPLLNGVAIGVGIALVLLYILSLHSSYLASIATSTSCKPS